MKKYLWVAVLFILVLAVGSVLVKLSQLYPDVPVKEPIKEAPTSCIKAGEIWLNSGGREIGKCCEGLTEIAELSIPISGNISCEELSSATGGSICSACGNNNCEAWENWCNCPEDCVKNCIPEGMLFSTMPRPPSGMIPQPEVVLKCCDGLMELYAMDVAVCANCGNGKCDSFDAGIKEDSTNCPEDCK